MEPGKGGVAGSSSGAVAPLDVYCPRYRHAVELVGRRWTGAILRVLLLGPRRYAALASEIPGLSERLLSGRLRELDAEGLVVRRVLAGPPLGVEYELTEAGRDLEPVIRSLAGWAEKWIPPPGTGVE